MKISAWTLLTAIVCGSAAFSQDDRLVKLWVSTPNPTPARLEATRKVLQRRLEAASLSGTVTYQNKRFVVRLKSGLEPDGINGVERLLTHPGTLSVCLINPQAVDRVARSAELSRSANLLPSTDLESCVPLNSYIQNIDISDTGGFDARMPILVLHLDALGQKHLASFSADSSLVTVVDGKLLFTQKASEAFQGRQAQLVLPLKDQEFSELIQVLRGGVLPLKLETLR